jgi:hypothetical protein
MFNIRIINHKKNLLNHTSMRDYLYSYIDFFSTCDDLLLMAYFIYNHPNFEKPIYVHLKTDDENEAVSLIENIELRKLQEFVKNVFIIKVSCPNSNYNLDKYNPHCCHGKKPHPIHIIKTKFIEGNYDNLEYEKKLLCNYLKKNKIKYNIWQESIYVVDDTDINILKDELNKINGIFGSQEILYLSDDLYTNMNQTNKYFKYQRQLSYLLK